MPCVTVRGCDIGVGRPKIIVPVVETSEADIAARAAEAAALRVDCIEWRADWFDALDDAAAVLHCLKALRAAVGEKLLLVTCRTAAEGGEKALELEAYKGFCRTVCASGCADLLDIELFTAGAQLSGLIAEAHNAGVKVVCSSHDFAKTPPRAEMTARMVNMQRAGADIAKLAVMPQSRSDVLELAAASADMADAHPQTPVITISMGELGVVTRICGEDTGSAMTFACAGKASAPGQLSVDDINFAIDALHKIRHGGQKGE